MKINKMKAVITLTIKANEEDSPKSIKAGLQESVSAMLVNDDVWKEVSINSVKVEKMPLKNEKYGKTYAEYNEQEKEDDLVMIAFIIGDSVAGELYKVINAGYMAMLDEIRKWPEEFFQLHQHTEWEENEEDWDIEVQNFAVKKMEELKK